MNKEKYHVSYKNLNDIKPIFEGFDAFEEPPLYIALLTYFSFALLIVIGHVKDFLSKINLINDNLNHYEKGNKGFVPLYSDFEDFFNRHIYRRVRDCYNRPIKSTPGGRVEVVNRIVDGNNWNFEMKSSSRECLNLSSYNYLGFAQSEGPCSDFAIEALEKFSVCTASPMFELGTQTIHVECERIVSWFVGKEAALICGMGFAVNSTILPALVDEQCIIMSDSLNHASLILGAKVSGAKIQVYKHNNMKNLEFLLKKAISYGQPLTRKPWKKILIVVEGIYSMEGVMANLPEIIRLKKKYKAYLYLDEAHSIGSLGKKGRGVAEYWQVDTKDIDIMMGTFTKSFSSAGGFVAADKEIIDYLRSKAHSCVYASSMSAPICAQIIKSIEIITGLDGTQTGEKLLTQLHRNTRYFRKKCMEMGYIVYGSDDSPIVPILIYQPGKAFSRMMLQRKIALVVVGYPATDIISSRARICLSSSHTRDELNYALSVLDTIGDVLSLKYSKQRHVIGKFIPEEE